MYKRTITQWACSSVWTEHLPSKQRVAGSNPVTPIPSNFPWAIFFAIGTCCEKRVINA